jgi:hypothetical protein
MASLSELIEDLEGLIQRSDDQLAKSMSRVQIELFKEIKDILRSFQDQNFRLSNPNSDLTLYNELRRRLSAVFTQSDYIPGIERYLASFDTLEPLSKELITTGANRGVKSAINALNTGVERELIAGQIANQLIKPTSIENAFIQPLQRLLYNSVQGNSTYAQAEAAFRDILITIPEKKQGFVRRYVTQLTRDGLNQYNGSINQKAVNEVGLNAFQYVGSLLAKDSRVNCIELVNGSGAFEQFAIGNRLYRIADLPEIIAIAENRPGWIEGTTPQTFFINRGGYNCRHRAIPRVIV